MPLYSTKLKHRRRIIEIKQKVADVYLWQEIEIYWHKYPKMIDGVQERKDRGYIQRSHII